MQASLVSYSNQHISLKVAGEKDGKVWQSIGFYGETMSSRKRDSWKLLRQLQSTNGMTWLCLGDFNEILHQHEKVGATLKPLSQMEDFKLALEECGLHDSGYSRDKFTWSNNQDGQQFTKEMLDSVLGNSAWHEFF